MLNYIFVPVTGNIKLKEFDPSITKMFDIANREVGGIHTDFTCFDQPPFVIIADDSGDIAGMKENTRIGRFTSRGKFFGNCIIIKASPDYRPRSDYSEIDYINQEEINYIIKMLRS